MTDPLSDALANRADPRTIERERLRVETESAVTPAEKRSIGARIAQVIGWFAGLFT